MECVTRGRERKWQLLHGTLVYLLLLFFLFRPVNFYLMDRVHASYYRMALPALIALYFYARGLRGGWELRLVAAYSLWIFLSRLLNGQLFLKLDWDLVLESFLVCVLLGLGPALDGKGRQRFLDLFSVTVVGFLTVLSAAAMYTILTLRNLVNPITQANFVRFDAQSPRLQLLDFNPNNCGNWLLVSFCLSLYLFFRCRGRKGLRLCLLLSMLLQYICIAMTYTRSIRLALALVLGLLAAMLLLEHRPIRRWGRKLAALVLVLAVVSPLCYQSFDAVAAGMSALGRSLRAGEQTDTEAGTEVVMKEREISLLKDTGRIPIYKSAFTALRQEPERLLKGSLTRDIVAITDASPEIRSFYGHFHNSYLQILVVGGIPGFLLAMGFFLLLVRDVLRLFFAPAGALAFSNRVLLLPVTGGLVYNLVESSLFCAMDLRAVLFFVIAGFVIAAAAQLPDGKKSGNS